MISKTLNIAKSNNSIPVWGLPFPLIASKVWLVQNIQESIQIPFGCNVAIFSYSSGPSVQVCETTSESLPVQGSGFSATKARMNPASAYVTGGQTLYFTSANTNGDIVEVGFYSNEESYS